MSCVTRCLTAVVAVVFSVAVRAAPLDRAASASGNIDVDDTIISLERESWVAWQTHDGKFFDRFLANDHLDVGPGGAINKASVVAGVAGPLCKVESYSLSDFQIVHIAEDTALLVYRAKQQTLCGGVPVPSPAWATSVYVKRDGRWLNILYQQTPQASRQ